MKPIIQIENLSKKYSISDKQAYYSFRDSIVETIRNPFKFLNNNCQKDFWALKNISLNIHPGEVIGIIGHNGAGKSTLLKILTQITPPTKGQAIIRGKVASFLEVGTGFHQELTGRENIFLNGAVLGMTKKEINNVFDKIVEFSGIEEFLDMPVKQYSSGMQVRLGFSVAAHMQPDILLIDEILAVGDVEFQKKCLGKMKDVTRQDGRTLLFVSHNMESVSRLCNRVIILKDGRIIADCETATAIDKYLNSNAGLNNHKTWTKENAPGNNYAKLKSVRILNPRGSNTFDIRFPINIEIEYWNFKEGLKFFNALTFSNEQGITLFIALDRDKKAKGVGLYRAKCTIPGNLFAEGRIRVSVDISTTTPIHQIHATIPDVLFFQIIDKGEPGSVRDGWEGNLPGVLRPVTKWKTSIIPQD